MALLRSVLNTSANKKYNFLLSSIKNGKFGKINVNDLVLKSSSTCYATAATTQVQAAPYSDTLDVSFNDARAAFKSKTNWELFRSYLVYTLCSFDYLVENNMK
ncbi:hypothetical protein WA026_002664, partial [Henosepilachna vigintioctopunctata]